MPEDSFESRTEPATPRRRQEARERGHVARSQDLSTATVLLAAMLAFSFFGGTMASDLLALLRAILEHAGTADIDPASVPHYALAGLLKVLRALLPLGLFVLVAALGVNLLQSGFVLSGEPLMPQISRLDPFAGLRRIFSMRGLVRLLSGLFKLAVVSAVLYQTLENRVGLILDLPDMEVPRIVANLADLSLLVGMRTALALFALALLEYGYQRWQYEQDLRMTRHEVKEELRRLEGDPKIRERRRAIQRQLAVHRMMQKVPKATVVITNPTEFAVALRYDEDTPAPVLVAKGKDHVAERIRSVALEHGIPIVEKRWLAQAIYRDVELDQPIPQELYAAVAEILAYVYRLRPHARFARAVAGGAA